MKQKLLKIIKKLLPTIGILLLNSLIFALIFINLRYLDMPEFVSIILGIMIIAADILYIKKTHNIKIIKPIISVISALSSAISPTVSYCNPYWNSTTYKENVNNDTDKNYDTVLTSKEAKEDLVYAIKYLKKVHPVSEKDLPEETKNQYNKVLKEIENSDQIDIVTLNQKIESVFSTIKDANTFVTANYINIHFRKDKDIRALENYKIVAINNTAILKILENNFDHYSYKSKIFGLYKLKKDIDTLEGLIYLGFKVADGIEFTYEKDGVFETVKYFPSDFLTKDEYINYLNEYKRRNNILISNDDDTPVRYNIDKKHNLATLILNDCKYNDQYIKCLKNMFTEVKEKNIKNIAVDLRNADGDNLSAIQEFIKYINIDSYQTFYSSRRLGFFKLGSSSNQKIQNKKYTNLIFDGNLYILTSKNTFNSAIKFTSLIKNNNLGKIIGEAPANKSNNYGDIVTFKLPNSQLLMNISSAEFNSLNGEKDNDVISLDIECKSDSALDKLYDILKNNNFNNINL